MGQTNELSLGNALQVLIDSCFLKTYTFFVEVPFSSGLLFWLAGQALAAGKWEDLAFFFYFFENFAKKYEK